MLTLMPGPKGCPILLDPYKKKGAQDFENWRLHLANAQSYVWSSWSDSLVEVYSKEHNLFPFN